MQALPPDATLILIDVQQAFNDPSWGTRNNPQAKENIAALLGGWRDAGRPVIHVQHRSPRPHSLFHPDQPGYPFKPEARPLPGEPVVHKDVNSAFIGTDLEQRLRAAGARTLVIAGLTTDHCVSTTTRMAGNLGFDTLLVGDAAATFDRHGPDGAYYTAQQMHDAALASVHKEFATVVTAREMLARLY
ncbi:MAG TPA: cysteine hydrolase family protein [Telluria sp.]